MAALQPPLATLCPIDLVARWSSLSSAQEVTGFYGHSHGAYRSFSNFYMHGPISFKVPEHCWDPAWAAAFKLPREVRIEFSEKSIMLCKAALFRDAKAYKALLAQGLQPEQCKGIGRRVKGFMPPAWDAAVLMVALEVVYQKFSQLPSERTLLLNTGTTLIAEASRNDAIWGIGCGIEDLRVIQDPKRWRGSNILGWALMEARSRFRIAALGGCAVVAPPAGVDTGSSASSAEQLSNWACAQCTFSNSAESPACVICSHPRSDPITMEEEEEAAPRSSSQTAQQSRRADKRAKEIRGRFE
mmetsp:Transcript_36575/g.72442  ORF Transcript_36575/g.72442 Transcript_36575/m.72442 type:complete len:300 (+) Transcript_36575:83-982(+)